MSEDDFDDEGGFDEDGPSSKPIREGPGFYGETGALFLVGRRISAKMNAAQILAFFDAVSATSKDADFRVVPAADFSRWTEIENEESHYTSWAVGIRVESAFANSPGPSDPIDLKRIRSQEKKADKLLTPAFWKKVAEHLDDESLREELLEGKNTPLLVACGPLASARLAFGKLKKGEGLEEMHGQDMEQEPHRESVYGIKVAGGGAWCLDEVDLSDERHAEHLAAVPGGKYFLIARYD